MLELLHQVRWQDALDIGIITFLVYRALQIVRGSRAMQMIIGLAVILVAYVSSRILGLFTLNWILDNFLSSIILVIIVIFQSDIRRALTQVGTAPLFSTLERSEQRREDQVCDHGGHAEHAERDAGFRQKRGAEAGEIGHKGRVEILQLVR